MTELVYTVTLNPSVDYVMKTEKIVLGEVNRTQYEELQFGGKGINVSAVLSELDVPTVAYGFVAGETGDMLKSLLSSGGVACEMLRASGGNTRINVKLKADTETDINGSGIELTDADIDLLCEKLGKMGADDVFCISGSLAKKCPDHTVKKLLTFAADKGALTVADMSGAALQEAILCKPFMIKPNIHEMEELVGRKLDTHEKIIDAAKSVIKSGVKNVLVTMGGDGAMLVTDNGESIYMPSKNGKVINSVGAGDSTVAGFIAGYLLYGVCEKALNLAVSAGGATAYSMGLATREEIEKLL